MTTHCSVIADLPVALLVASSPGESSPLQSVLQQARWRVRTAHGIAEACAEAACEPVSLVLLLGEGQAAQTVQTCSRLRLVNGPSGAAPILQLRSEGAQNDPDRIGVVAVITLPGGSDALRAELDRWRPVSLVQTRRIAEMFGAGPIAGMIERLAVRLEAALVRLEQGSPDRAEAHRLAGLCGTLGFGQAHAAWLDLSLGRDTPLHELRRTTRLTLAAIARGL